MYFRPRDRTGVVFLMNTYLGKEQYVCDQIKELFFEFADSLPAARIG